MFHTCYPRIYPYVQSNIWGWRLFGGDWPCIQQRRKFLHKKTSSYPPKSILQGRSKGWSKNEIEKATFNFFIHQFSLRENPSIRFFEKSDMFFLTKNTKTPFLRAALPRLQEDVFCGDVASATSLLQTLEETCDLSWQEDAIFVGVPCRGSWNH